MSEKVSRRRGERLDHAILDVAWRILTEVGYAKLTMEAVAAAAGTSRPVIHRRWPTRADLALAAVTHASPQAMEVPDTGELRSDVIALLTQTSRRFGTVHGETLAGVIAETARDPDASAALRALIARAAPHGHFRVIAGRAADRDEIAGVPLPERLARLPFDLLRNEIVLHGRPPSEETITEITDTILLPLLHHLGDDR